MQELPLFPLNTVLFPGVPLNLHIFEPRYRAMISRCLQEKSPFGVVLIRSGRESLGPLADPYEIGCSARIIKADPVGGGRMNIATVGVERFRILELDRAQDYLVGAVEPAPLLQDEDRDFRRLTDSLRHWVTQYLRHIADQLPEKVDGRFLPDRPLALAYIAAYLVQAPPADKQSLLEADSIGDLLTRLDRTYRREVAIVRALTAEEGPEERGFNLN